MRKKAILLGFIGYVCGCVIGLLFALQNENFNIRESLPTILLGGDRKSTRLNSSHPTTSRMPSSA